MEKLITVAQVIVPIFVTVLLGVLARLSLGLNLFNALVIAILGVPGLALLILLRLVFI